MVLTAGHCLSMVNSYTVLVNVDDISDLNNWEGNTYEVSEHVRHPQYSKSSHMLEYDALLVRLSRSVPIDIMKKNQFIKVDSNNIVGDMSNGDLVKTFGWGKTESNTLSSVLMQTYKSYIDLHTCKALYAFNLPLSQCHLCAASWTSSSCTGDSGGPLIKELEDGTDMLIGITSFGPSSCISESGILKPVVFTKIYEIYPWMKEYGCEWAPISSICLGNSFEYVDSNLIGFDVVGENMTSIPPDSSSSPLKIYEENVRLLTSISILMLTTYVIC